jgi:hypothetical protein
METISASVIPKEGHVRRVEWRTDLLVVDKLAHGIRMQSLCLVHSRVLLLEHARLPKDEDIVC